MSTSLADEIGWDDRREVSIPTHLLHPVDNTSYITKRMISEAGIRPGTEHMVYMGEGADGVVKGINYAEQWKPIPKWMHVARTALTGKKMSNVVPYTILLISTTAVALAAYHSKDAAVAAAIITVALNALYHWKRFPPSYISLIVGGGHTLQYVMGVIVLVLVLMSIVHCVTDTSPSTPTCSCVS